ncbi:hypothetical protein [Micromonospora phytophila]|nr:hypothetical protein [Micromonospora phytophila]
MSVVELIELAPGLEQAPIVPDQNAELHPPPAPLTRPLGDGIAQ